MKNEKRSSWRLSTKLSHPVEVHIPEGNKPLIRPIYQSVKFSPAENVSFADQFIYSRISNPTVRQLELTLAELQNKEDCIVLSSGIGAISGLFLSLLEAGDHIISFREIYKPSRTFIKEMLPKFGITSTLLSLNNVKVLESSIVPGKTKLIHFESPSNPNLDAADIDYILATAKKHGIFVSMDGTFAGLHQHTQYPIDIMVHSLTKYANGHGDVTAGSIAGSKPLIKKIREMTTYLGAALDAQAAYLIERGLKTYDLRYNKQTASALEIAKFLSTHPKVKVSRYPGLCGPLNHELLTKQMKDMGTIISFEIDASVSDSADKFCHRFKIISMAASVGSVESIICPTNTFFGADLNETDKREMGLSTFSLRLSVGLEDPKDLIEDLKSALNAN